MNLTDDNERKRVKIWASDNHIKAGQKREEAEKTDGTFWSTRDGEHTYMVKYDFEMLSEFEDMCSLILREEIDDYILKTIEVSMVKNRPEEDEEEDYSLNIPEYIYTL